MCSKSPIAATINATTRKVIPAQRRLPVRKNTSMAARGRDGEGEQDAYDDYDDQCDDEQYYQEP